MRHYVGKFSQARHFLFIQLGLINAFKPHALSTVRVKDLHIKYQGEARPGQPLKIMSAILSVSDQTIRLCHIMYHADGHIAATQVETAEHVYLRNNQAFAWPKRLLENAERFSSTCPDTPPDPAMPRNIDTQTPHIGHSTEALKVHNLSPLGVGVYTAAEMNAAGFASTEAMFGRSTSTAGGVNDVISADRYTRTFLHNFNDAVTGECQSSYVVNGCLFNLKSRKLTKATPEQLNIIAPFIRADLTP